MLDYEWGNPSPEMLDGHDSGPEMEQGRQIFDHYTQNSFAEGCLVSGSSGGAVAVLSHPHHHNHQHVVTAAHPHYHYPCYDPRSFYMGSGSGSYLTHQPPPVLGGLDGGAGEFTLVPKTEEQPPPPPPATMVDFTARLGLNLGGRTYFSSADDEFVDRLYRRSRSGPGVDLVSPGAANPPRCQAEGCSADLSNSKHYHRRHKVCEFHSKASTVVANGLTQRFCQQCSRFHILSEFDNGKRSCRRRLADHNRRRRKSNQSNNEKLQLEVFAPNSRSPPEYRALSTVSATLAISPPRMSLDCFRGRPYHAPATTSASSSSIFFSSG